MTASTAYRNLPQGLRILSLSDAWGLNVSQLQLLGCLAHHDQTERDAGRAGLTAREMARMVGTRRERIAPLLTAYRKLDQQRSDDRDRIQREVDAARTAPGPDHEAEHRKPNGHIDWAQIRDDDPQRAKRQPVVIDSAIRRPEEPPHAHP